jgi:alpha-tubulin suppressor-like RCC1 family protein
MGYLWGLLGACGAACGEEFPNEPTGTLTIQVGSGSRDTMTVRESANLVVDISDSRGETITGIQVSWKSSDTTLLELQPASSTSSPEGSLAAQLTIQAIAHARGKAIVVATVDRPGFQRAELQDTITILERWLAISAGASHTCAIAADSSAYCWGNGTDGALGNGQPIDTPVPMEVIGIGSLKFLSISAGDRNTCAIAVQRVAYCWGLGTLGRLGNGSQATQFTPTLVSLGRTFKNISAGQTSCAVSELSVSFCWGSNSDLQLGSPLASFDKCGALDCSLTPLAVRSVSGDTLRFSLVDVATFHTCGISSAPSTDRQAFCWGSGTLTPGTLTPIYLLGDAIFTSQEPIQVAPPLPSLQNLTFTSLSAGELHTCGVTTSGDLYCWGGNGRGQLGINSRTDQARPTASVTGIQFDSVSSGSSHSCALTATKDAYCWGANDYGQLGTDSHSTDDRLVPALAIGEHSFVSLSAGNFHTCGITTDGAAFCWGRNTAGQLGSTVPTETCTVGVFPATNCSLTPTRVSEPIN